jgi:hypothetical protein
MVIDLTPERGLLFRITHVDNICWLLSNGLHCANAGMVDPTFVSIGNADLIGQRARKVVPIAPGGTLSDYVPFYLTPRSPMLFNIKTGYNGIIKRSNEDIVVLVASCESMASCSVRMLFTDRHAYVATTAWSGESSELATMIDWDILRSSDFARSDSYPDKMERYQAEALAYRYVPPAALVGVGCFSHAVATRLESDVRSANLAVKVVVRPRWYF